MLHLVPSLRSLALIGCAAAGLSAASIAPKEENLTLAVNGWLQTQLTLKPSSTYNNANAAGAAQNGFNAQAPTSAPDGVSYDPIRGQPGEPELAHFDMRRIRLGVVGTYKDNWRGGIVLTADKADSRFYNDRALALYSAWVSKQIKTGDITNELLFGLEKPYNGESSISNSVNLFPTNRPGGDFVNLVRGVGAQYRMYGPMYTVAASVLNGLSTVNSQGGSANGVGQESSQGYCANLRAEVAPGASFLPKKKQESYAGAEGTHDLLGIDLIGEWNRLVSTYTNQAPATVANPWNKQNCLIWGPDLLVHVDGLTAMVDYKFRTTTWEGTADWAQDVPNPDQRRSAVFDVQAGYALRLSEGLVAEPAARFARIDMDTEAEEYANYGRGVDYSGLITIDPSANTYGGARTNSLLSGDQVEVGVNLYFNAHANKLQLSYLDWRAEEGIGSTRMVILQHQFMF